MKLDDELLQKLKDGTIQFENLDDDFFVHYLADEYNNAKIAVEDILELLNSNICSFKQIINRLNGLWSLFDSEPCLFILLENKKLFEEVIKINKLTKEDLKYLLNQLCAEIELALLCRNRPLIKHILNEFALDNKIVDKFSSILNDSKESWRDSEDEKICNIFEFIEFWNNDDEEILKLNELNRKIYELDFNTEQNLKIYELIRNDERARNRMIQIIENHLELNYNFDSLISYLEKNEKKNILNI